MAKTIGDIADEILVAEAKIKAMKLKVDDEEKKVDQLKDRLKQMADKLGLTSGGGKRAKFDIKPETMPQVSNWDEFVRYMVENNYFHLVHRRPGSTACQELWERGVNIPGIDKFTKVKVNVKGA